MSPRLKSALSFVVRLALSGGMLWLAASKTDLRQVENNLLAVEPTLFVAAVLLLLGQTLIMNARWMLIMEALDTPMHWLNGERILLVSLWFNQALPSTIGGDVVRIWMVHRENVAWGKAVIGVLADRVTALFGLVLMIIAGSPFLFMRVNNARAIIAIVGLACAGLAGTVILVSLDHLPLRIRSIWPISGFVSLGTLVRFLLLKFQPRRTLLAAAILIHLLTTLTCFLLAAGLHAGLTIGNALLLIPPVVLLSAIPISISGWGVRESAMVAALTAVGVSSSAALATSVLLGLVSAVVGMVGGVVWMASRERHIFTAGAQATAEREISSAGRSLVA